MPTMILAVTFDSGGLLGSCLFYLFSGVIAGTVATFVVRGRLGCVFGNFFLGIVGAVIVKFLLDFVGKIPGFGQINTLQIGFMATTILASVAATLIALVFTQALKAERRHQQNLLDRYGAAPTEPPK